MANENRRMEMEMTCSPAPESKWGECNFEGELDDSSSISTFSCEGMLIDEDDDDDDNTPICNAIPTAIYLENNKKEASTPSRYPDSPPGDKLMLNEDITIVSNDPSSIHLIHDRKRKAESKEWQDSYSKSLVAASLKDLPDELVCGIGSFLDVGSLKRARLASKKLSLLLSRDGAGWVQSCHRLWSRKVHVDRVATEAVKQQQQQQQQQQNENGGKQPMLSAFDAYRLSCIDGRLRHEIRNEELIFDPRNPQNSTVWFFRFKEGAGRQWTDFDPWYSGAEARRMVFLADGTVWQLEEVRGGGGATSSNNIQNDDTTTFNFRRPFFSARDPRGLEVRWRYVSQPLDLPRRDDGAYLRLTVGGKDVPTYIIRRSPNGNWGFVLENLWGVFASFALPRRTTHGNVARPARIRLRRLSNGGSRWLDVGEMESDEDEEEERGHTDAELLGDHALAITSDWQWREAFLYNLGATSLPDGSASSWPVRLV